LPVSAAGAWPRVYVPLGVDGHVDHLLVRTAAGAWADAEPAIRPQLAYYEDYPCSAEPGAIERVIGSSPDELATWTPCPIDLDELAAKIDAIGAYASQISSFWADAAAMAEAVRASARGRGERLMSVPMTWTGSAASHPWHLRRSPAEGQAPQHSEGQEGPRV
jgi:LmbE family N-acetylglucosaminyl deacetylase